ncbi:hypothetical protein FBU30_008885 [Linnemannia zychae]|nr:hypothetical protein FBU30_008885 [Linnemannia zychae]
MTPLTTTDDDSSTIASTHLQQHPRIPRSRQVSKNGSLSSSFTSPLSVYPHSDLSSQLNTLTLQTDAYSQHRQSPSLYRGDDGKDGRLETSSVISAKSGTISVTASTIASTITSSPSAGNGGPLQLLVRHVEQGASYTGYLTKFSSRTFFSRKQWKRRYFALNQQSLYCFKSSDPQHPLLETLDLCAETIVCVTDIFSGKRYCLQITSPGEKNWYVLADTANELSGWLRQLKGTVLRCRNPQQAMHQDQRLSEMSRPRTHYSDSSEWSDLSSAASYGLMDGSGMPSSHHNSNLVNSYLTSRSRPSSPPLTPPRRTPHPSERLDPYSVTPVGGMNPHPRPMTPSFPPASGSDSILVQEQSFGRLEDQHRHHSYRQTSSDYTSFGAAMEQAETVSPVTIHHRQGSSGDDTEGARFLSFPPKESNHLSPQHPHYVQQKKKQQKRDSSLADFSSEIDLFTNTEGSSGIATRRGSSGTFSISSSGSGSRRVSVVIDRPETMITLPRRSSQRLMGSPSRPMSPVSSRPMSPNASRPSPRSSLVVAPPPRSIHRPSSVSMRHSTQMISPLQIATHNLQQGIKAAAEQQRSVSPLDSPQRPNSRLSHFRYPSNVGLIYDRSPNGLGRVSMDRPLSPTPAGLASPPTSPLPEPPRSGSVSPVQALRHSLSNSSSSSHRISIVPRHHDPDLLVSHRANPRSRAQSQESALISRANDKQFGQQQQLPHRASSPLPNSTRGAMNENQYGQEIMRKHISFPINGKLILPPPPKGQQPDVPTASTATLHFQHHHNTFPRQHKHSLSSASISSMSSHTSSTHAFSAGVASFGGAIARKNSGRDSGLTARLSTLVPIPYGSVSSVPLPPQTALPPIPGSVPSPPRSPLPTPPTSDKIEVPDSAANVTDAAANVTDAATENNKDSKSINGDNSVAFTEAVAMPDLHTPPSSLLATLSSSSTVLSTPLVDKKENEPCITLATMTTESVVSATTPEQTEEKVQSVVNHQDEAMLGGETKVDALLEVPAVDEKEEEQQQRQSRQRQQSQALSFELVLEEAEESDVSVSEVVLEKDINSIDTTTITTTITTITTTNTKDHSDKDENETQDEIVVHLAIESPTSISS